MKINYFLAFIFLAHINNCFGQSNEGYTIEGHLLNLENRKVYLGNKGQGTNAGFKVKYFDSVLSKSGDFVFRGKLSEPNLYSIEIEGGRGWRPFVLENSHIIISGNADSLWLSRVSGSIEDSLYKQLAKLERPIILDMNAAGNNSSKYSAEKDTTLSKSYANLNQKYADDLARTEYAFGITHPTAFVNLLNAENIKRRLGADSARMFYNALTLQLRSHSRTADVRYALFDMDSNLLVNGPAPLFNQNDNKSRPVSLDEFKGSYVLLDFWASWCRPCRAENPTMKEAYHKYKKHNFQILGISLDVDRSKWLKAIKEDKLPWKQISDLNGGENKVAKLYGVGSIPMNFLLDPNGIIIAKNLRGKDLEKFLKTVIKK